MTTNQIFSFPRFMHLFREETFSGHRMTLIVASVVFVFLAINAAIMAEGQDFVNFHQVWYSMILLGSGFYFTSNSFNELNQKEQRMQYLSLPSSIFEKLTMKLLITSLGYVILFTALYWVFAQVADVIAAYFNYSFLPFNPVAPFYLFMIKLYLVIQSIFILGAIAFNRFAFFKTLFALFLLVLVFGVIMWIIFRILFAEYFDGVFTPVDNVQVIPGKNFQNFIEFTAWPVLQHIFWFVLAPLFWVVAYFKLKEREV
jgi:hypothetical protein